MRTKSKIIISAVLVSLALGSLPVFANGGTTTSRERNTNTTQVNSETGEMRQVSQEVTTLRERAANRLSEDERQQRINEFRALQGQERCDRVLGNITARIDFYDANHDRVVGQYREIAAKLERAINTLNAQGIDTTDLEGYLTEVGSMLTDLNNTQSELIAELRQSEQIACSDTEAFRASLQNAKQLLGQIRAMLREKKDFVQTTVVPELRSLLSSLRN